MYRGAVFFDMDGTLVDGSQGVLTPTQKTVEAIARLKENHILTGLATGRAKCYIAPETKIFDCYVTSNGAYAEVDGIEVCNNFIEKQNLERVTRYLQEQGINYVAEGQNACYVYDLQEPYFQQMLKNFLWSPKCFFQMGDTIPIPVNKLMVSYDSKEKLHQFMADFGQEYDITEQPGNQASDVGKKGITKGYGVKKVLEYFGLKPESAYAFGDADNDLDMMSAVGNGIAMGRHTKRLEEVCCYITGTVKEEGIYCGLEHFHLI